MYIEAIIKNRQGERFAVKATAGCEILVPLSMVDRINYAVATNRLLADYASKIRRYANKDHAIVEIHTDNFMVLDRLSKSYNAHYVPEVGVDGGAAPDA